MGRGKGMKKKLILLLCVCVFGSMSTITGCSEKKEAKKEETEQKKELKKIGEEKGSDYKIELKNSTGKKITGISVKLIETTEYPENMLKNGEIYEVGESRELYYTVPESNVGGEKELTSGYDIQLTFEDNSTAELHSFPFEDIKKGEICFDEVAYVKYTSVSSKDKVETKEAELAIKTEKEAEAKAAAEAAAQAAAEEAARQEAEEEAARQAAEEAARQAAEEEAARQAAEEAARAEEQQNSNTQNSPEESNSGDGCVQDGLLW